MKYQNYRDKEIKESKHLTIFIGKDKYRLEESIDGKLTINKYNEDGDPLIVYPRVSNEIDVV